MPRRDTESKIKLQTKFSVRFLKIIVLNIFRDSCGIYQVSFFRFGLLNRVKQKFENSSGKKFRMKNY